jgi:DNA (cytosine-5)-methyltransferase 1
MIGHLPRRPLGCITAKDHHALTCAFLSKFYGTAKAGTQLDLPLPTVTTGGGRGGGHFAQVQAFLMKYYGAESGQNQDVRAPLDTVTTKARFGLVAVHGEPYYIVDIGMRMLQPHELFAAQGFPDDYNIRSEYNGKPMTKTAQIFLCGNAVPPVWPEAIVSANGTVN